MDARLSGRWGLVLVLGVVLLLRLPFLNQAIQGDDDTYLAEAKHALIDPLHPEHTAYIFQGNAVDLRGHPHPPLNAWVLAGLLAVFGDVKEVPFHAVYIVFSLIAAAAMWSLATRFSPRPLWATLLFLAVPAFVVNGNSLETDLPFLAFWTAAIALFCADRLWLSALVMALAAMTAYQAIFLTPILAVWLWLRGAGPRPAHAWAIIFTPVATIAAWQMFERLTTGALPAAVLTGYFASGGFQALPLKLQNAAAMAIHFCFIVFPALLPGAFLLAWRKRREPETQFLLAWTAIFFVGAIAVFFAGAARYLLPIAAPLALLASRLPGKWLAIGFGAQMALSLGLAAVSYQHWDGVRQFAAALHRTSEGHRVWVNGELGVRYYLEADGALPLVRGHEPRADDIVVTSELTRWRDLTAPVSTLLRTTIQPSIPLRLIGVASHSGFSTVSRGFWPFGISRGAIDRLRADLLLERRPALEYLLMNAPEAAGQIVSGIYPDHWMGRSATVVLKTPPQAAPLVVSFFLPPQARGRHVKVLLDGRLLAEQIYASSGTYTLQSGPVLPGAPSASVEVEVDRTFRAPPDTRDLGVILTAIGFKR